MPVAIHTGPRPPIQFEAAIDLLTLDRFGKDLKTGEQVIDITGKTQYLVQHYTQHRLVRFGPVWFGMTVSGVPSGSTQYDRPGENASPFGRYAWPIIQGGTDEA